MKNGTRFNIVIGADIDPDGTVTGFLEAQGRRKSKIVAAAIREYMGRHTSDGNAPSPVPDDEKSQLSYADMQGMINQAVKQALAGIDAEKSHPVKSQEKPQSLNPTANTANSESIPDEPPFIPQQRKSDSPRSDYSHDKSDVYSEIQQKIRSMPENERHKKSERLMGLIGRMK